MTLYPHQRDAVAFGRRGSRGFFLDMGLGKTRIGLTLIGETPGLNVVVAPLSASLAWESEAVALGSAIHVVNVCGQTAKRREGKIKEALKTATEKPVIVLTNYEIVREILKPLNGAAIKTVIADESHYIKSYKAIRSKACHALAARAERRYILSGTPIMHSPLDLWSQSRFVSDKIFPETWWAFRGRYARMGGFERKQVIGFNDLDGMRSRLAPHVMILKKEDVIDLPGFRIIPVEIDLDDKEKRAYELIKKEAVIDLMSLGEYAPLTNALAKVSKLQQAASGFVYHEIFNDNCEPTRAVERYGRSKENAVLDLVEGAPDEPIVIWSVFREEAARLVARLRIAGHGVADGSSNPLDAAREFIDGRARVIVASPQSLGAGVNFQRAAIAIHVSHTYSYGIREQADARIYRIGQTRPVVVYDVLARGTLDKRIRGIVSKKGDVAELVLDELGIKTQR